MLFFRLSTCLHICSLDHRVWDGDHRVWDGDGWVELGVVDAVGTAGQVMQTGSQ